MSAIITNAFRLTNAESFIGNLQNTSNYYLSIGRPHAWTDDLNAPTPIDSYSSVPKYWKESMAAKKIQSSDVIQATQRFNWTSGTIYTQYDSTINLNGLQFYVLTSDYNVYKCISNNSGVASTIMPTSTGNSIFQTADGYSWKYLYTLSQSDVLKFLTTDYIPVKTNATVQAAAINGGVHNVKIDVGGTGYTTATISLDGDGSGFAGTVNISSGVITGITVTNPGTGYTIAKAIITGNGSNGAATPIISPTGGHGSDVESELNSYFVAIATELSFNINADFPSNNDYRRIMIIKDPTLQGGNTIAAAATYSLTTDYTIVHVSGSTVLESDEVITGTSTGSVSRIVQSTQTSSSPLTYSIRTVQDLETSVSDMSPSENVTTSSGGVWDITTVTESELNHGSGQIIFVEQRRPIMRATNQNENIIIIAQF